MKVGVHLNFPNGLKFLGYRKMDSNFWPINFLILMTKRYIYKCAYKELIKNLYVHLILCNHHIVYGKHCKSIP